MVSPSRMEYSTARATQDASLLPDIMRLCSGIGQRRSSSKMSRSSGIAIVRDRSE